MPRAKSKLWLEMREHWNVQVCAGMLLRVPRPGYNCKAEWVDEVLSNKKKYGHTAKSFQKLVDAYTSYGCGIVG